MNRLIFLALLFAVSCNSPETTNNKNPGKKDTANSETNVAATPADLSGCYKWVVKRDTAAMDLEVAGNKVTGHLNYNWYQKDKSTGTLNGIIKSDLIIADYTFQSEGVTSVRQLVFKVTEGGLAEGTGDYNIGSDTLLFNNIDDLKFQYNDKFIKTECASVIK